MDNEEEVTVTFFSDCFLLTFPRVTSSNRGISLRKIATLTNLMNELTVVNVLHTREDKRFWFVRASRADMTHNLLQV